MPFDLDEFLKDRPLILGSTELENYKAANPKPIWLEDVGLKPERVLGEGDYKNYKYQRAAEPFRSAPLGPAPLPGPRPLPGR